MFKRAWLLASVAWAAACVYGMTAKTSVNALDFVIAFIGLELALVWRFVRRGSLRAG
jgi:hypothetical protein